MTRPRVLWLAGTRTEVLQLAPNLQALQQGERLRDALTWFAVTGEQGVAVYQALDDCGVRPDEEAELRHPAEDPAARLRGLIDEIETLARRHRATHLVFAGCGPTAAAAALVCHGRGLRGVWLRPNDAVGLISRLRWERGLEAVILSLSECVEVIHNAVPSARLRGLVGISGTGELPPGRREGALLVMLGITRPAWGSSDVPERIVAAVARWARRAPEIDWLFLRSLDARFEGPIGSLTERPSNFLTAPPVPHGVYADWLWGAQTIVTDSWAMAAEAAVAGVQVVALGESEDPSVGRATQPWAIVPSDFDGDELGEFLIRSLRGRGGGMDGAGLWGATSATVQALEAALDRASAGTV